jgi:GNAT superfamily N-acetyltransferase
MLAKLASYDRVLDQNLFMTDEVQYNLVHRICETGSSTCLKTSDGKMIYAQSQGHNAWLWISGNVTDDKRKVLMQELVGNIKGFTLPGISGDPQTAEMFAKIYSEANGIQYHLHMMLESYSCPKVKKPLDVRGTIQQATRQNVEIVAEFMAGFSEGAYGVSVDPISQISAAEGAVGAGNLYLWMVEDRPVSMATIAHRSARHARINAVFTPPALRKKGFASAIVAELCSILERENITPMLYADMKNPDANKVYKNIGFVENGKIADIRFE